MAAARRLGAEPNQPADRIRVSFFNDYSAALARKRKAFDEVKGCLRRKNVEYALLYPAPLRLSVNGVARVKRMSHLSALSRRQEKEGLDLVTFNLNEDPFEVSLHI
ncbi:unnamed protein product [Pleuronectes platessa]|uniref:Uncharacterized protein n=1 Tax=Pleuronectes platessa TaxID=8262 RepID=A0A9N7VEJ4_PLEPL|nr:unnamed protein product [Pleuronectes platessa]